MRIRTKFLVPAIVGMMVLGCTVYVIAANVFQSTIEESVNRRIRDLIAATERESDLLAERAVQLSSILADLPEVKEAYRSMQEGNLENESDPVVQKAREKLRLDLVRYLASFRNMSHGNVLKAHFHLPTIRSFLRVWRSRQALREGQWIDVSDDLSSFRQTVVVVNQKRSPIKGLELGRGGFTIRGLVPITMEDGRHAGSVEVLYAYEDVLHRVLDPANTRFALFMNKRFLPITTAFENRETFPIVPDETGEYVLLASTLDKNTKPRFRTETLARGYGQSFSERSGDLFRSYFPIKDYNGKPIGVVQLETDISVVHQTITMFRLYVIGTTIGLIVLLTFLLVLIGQRITRPVQVMMDRLNNIAYADGDLSSRLIVRSTDEIGGVAVLFNAFVARLQASFSEITADLVELQKKVNALLSNATLPTGDVKNEVKKEDAPIQVHSIDEATRAVGKIIDKVEIAIAQRSRIEEAQRLLVAIVESSNDAIMAVDREGCILTWNLGAIRLYGYEEKEILGLPLATLIDGSRTEELKSIREAIESGVVFRNYETIRRTKDGRSFPVSILVSPILSENGERKGAAVIERDITRRKELEKSAEIRRKQLMQADKLASLGTLVAGMAHEISNPNSFIMLNSPIILEIWQGVLPVLDRYYEENGDFQIGKMNYSSCREWVPMLLEDIGKGADRIKGIVSNLKDFARQDISSMDQDVDLNEVVNSAITLTGNRLKKTTRKLSVELNENLPKVKGNFQRIEQVVINLILNACDALPDMDRALRISTRMEEGTPKRVLLYVEDEGEGIEAEIMDRIKDPFFTTKRESGGTGLGLSISDGIIKDHDGVLSFDSIVGKGTKVTIGIPVSEDGTDR